MTYEEKRNAVINGLGQLSDQYRDEMNLRLADKIDELRDYLSWGDDANAVALYDILKGS